MSVLVEKADLSLKYAAHFNEVREILFKGSSDTLNQARMKGFRDFIKQGIPSRKNENYKYSNLNPRFTPEFNFLHQADDDVDPNPNKGCNIPQLNSNLFTVTNGWFDDNGSKDLPEGVILDSLQKISNSRPELIEKYYSKLAMTETDPMIALNTAFAKDGFFLYVPRKIAVNNPIQIINFLNATKDTFVTQRNLIIIEPGAEVKIINCDNTLNLNEYLSNSVTEIFVGENAVLDYYTLQNQHNFTTGINSLVIEQKRDSVVTTHTSTLHGGFIRNNLKFNLNGENAEANMFGMAFIDRKQHVDNFTQVIHSKPHCESNQIYKNVLDDEGTGVFSGQIHVVRDAQKTNAFQQNNNLLLTDEASMQTKPQLIIDADDVKCSHGATVGQIDKEALFYLRTRGIDEDKAKLMMMNAFAYEVVQKIKVENLRDHIDDLIEKRLKGEVAKCHDCEYNCED